MVIELRLDQGPYAGDVDHYLRLLSYLLVQPPTPGIEEDMIKAFVLRELMFVRQLGYGSPADKEDGDGHFAVPVCLGAEAVLAHYRQQQDVHAAARFAADCSNWRCWETGVIYRHIDVFRKARKQVPAEFWELQWISMESFSMIMLPKMRAEGRIPKRDATRIARQGPNGYLVVISRRSHWVYKLEDDTPKGSYISADE